MKYFPNNDVEYFVYNRLKIATSVASAVEYGDFRSESSSVPKQQISRSGMHRLPS